MRYTEPLGFTVNYYKQIVIRVCLCMFVYLIMSVRYWRVTSQPLPANETFNVQIFDWPQLTKASS